MAGREKKMGRQKYKKLNILDEIKSIFHKFWRAIIWWDIEIWQKIAHKRFMKEEVWHWNIDRVLNKELLLENHAENVHQRLFPDPFLTLVNNPKKPLHARNFFNNKIFWKRIIKMP